ncbi:MAG: LamG domain-containing protein, partial [Rubrivivax sp.]|nr:LamG domain-containing protein [Rubrivivax sp.]
MTAHVFHLPTVRRRPAGRAPAWLAVWLGLLWLLVAPLDAWAGSYAFRSASYAWESATNTVSWDRVCTGYPGDDDQATITFTGGFKFTFAGQAYSSVRVLANGILQFGAETGLFRDYTNSNLPAGVASPTRTGCVSGPTTLALMAYWTDLNPSRAGSGGVTWQQKGTAPNRYLVVSWNSVYEYTSNTPYTFQVVLYEDGTFKYQYGNANASGANATIGVQVDDGDYTLYAYNTGYNANGTAIRWGPANNSPTRLAEYRFDEAGYSGLVGEALDSTGNGHDGVAVGGLDTSATAYICRSLQVPANSSATSTVVDTLLDVDSAIGPAGGVSFWYRSNEVWSGNDAVLFDATTQSNRPFYLMRRGNGSLRFYATDGTGTIVSANTAAIGIGANTWTHVAATWRFASGSNQTVLRIYVDGALVATGTGTTAGTLDVSLASLFLGDNRSSVTPSGGSRNSTNGFLDEVRIYNYEIGLAEIAIDRAASHPCVPPVDHYELSAPTSAVACLGSTVTVTACLAAGTPCTAPATSLVGQTVTLSTSAGTLTPTSLVLDANGSASASLQHPAAADGSVVTVTLTGLPTVPSNGTYCLPDGSGGVIADRC